MLSFGEAVRAFYSGYVDFHGRSQRSAYWWVQLFSVIWYSIFAVLIFMGLGGVDGITAIVEEEDITQFGPSAVIGVVGVFVFLLANILPNIAVQVRRFHDLDQTGWLVLAFGVGGQIPIIGTFIAIGNLVWFCMQGTNGPNKYGPDPLYSQGDVFE